MEVHGLLHGYTSLPVVKALLGIFSLSRLRVESGRLYARFDHLS